MLFPILAKSMPEHTEENKSSSSKGHGSWAFFHRDQCECEWLSLREIVWSVSWLSFQEIFFCACICSNLSRREGGEEPVNELTS